MAFDVDVRGSGADRVVRVAGDIDLDSSPRLLPLLQESLRVAQTVKVDLAGVEYIDSSGVAVLIQGLKYAGKHGARFVLFDPSPRVMAVLELAQLPRLFDIERPDA